MSESHSQEDRKKELNCLFDGALHCESFPIGLKHAPRITLHTNLFELRYLIYPPPSVSMSLN